MRRCLGLALLLLLTSVVGHTACTSITVTALSFGTYTSTSTLSFTATITTHCTNGYAYVVGIGPGYSNNDSARTMTAGAIALNYGMYQNASHTINWGANNGVNTVNATGTGSNQTFTIYGVVPSGQYVAPGSYTDSMIAYIYNSGLYVTLNVSATVASSCAISTTNLNFGIYSGVQKDATATLSITCSGTTTYYVNLSDGTNVACCWQNRMTGAGAVTLNYTNYSDSARTIRWGNTVNNDGVAGTGNGNLQLLTVYGRLFGGAYVTPGVYSDTVIAKITY